MSAEHARFMPREGRSSSLAVLATLGLAITSSGCAPDTGDMDDGEVETAHLRITTTTENPICAGTPLLLEREVVRIAEALELPPWSESDKLEVRFGLDAVEEVCPQYDPNDISGCADPDGGVIAAKEVALHAPHEIVHAVRISNLSLGHSLFEEGMAQVLSGSDGFPLYVHYPHGEEYVGVAEMLALPRDFTHYVWGASFVSWLWQTHGQPSLMAFMNDPRMPDDQTLPLVFEEHFGQTLAEAGAAWAVDDRPDAVWGAPCTPERTYSLVDGPVEISGNLDCQAPDVYGAAYFMSIRPMCLDVPETTRVRITLQADHGRLSVLAADPCNPGPVGGEALRDKYVEAGEVLEEDISHCLHRLLFSSQALGFPATPYAIRIEEIAG